jgi:hypothetical protein
MQAESPRKATGSTSSSPNPSPGKFEATRKKLKVSTSSDVTTNPPS